MSDGDAGGGSSGAASAPAAAATSSDNANTSSSNNNSGTSGNSGSNDNGNAAAAGSNTNDTSNEMSTPYGVNANNNNHGQEHDDAMDRPPDLAYNRGRLNRSSPRKPGRHGFYLSGRQRTLDLDEYFTGPRDIQKHSKWPMFLQMHGSILPKMMLPLFVIGSWAMLVTCISYFTKKNLGISSILLTVTGFVVGLGLSFRSSTAYERYAEGRRYWAQLMLATQSLGRVFWVHAVERENEKEKDILAKLTSLNLLVGFAVALKHKLRYEPYTGYDDLVHLVGHLDTFALAATVKEPEKVHQPKPHILKLLGGYLGVSFAASNPRKAIKRAGHPLGNLPLEILTYLACFTDELVTNNQLVIPMHQTLAYNNIAVLNDVLMGTERVLTTPLPIAYSIAISQITWVYVFLLPFQLYPTLQWVTIPATIVASYIILGILFIGREIENPFGHNVNDLPLERYCAQMAAELDLIASKKKHRNKDWVESLDNKVLYPYSMSGWSVWKERGEQKVREALKAKTEMGFGDDATPPEGHGGHDGGDGRNGGDAADDTGDDKDLASESKHSTSGSTGSAGSGNTAPGRAQNLVRVPTRNLDYDEEANVGFCGCLPSSRGGCTNGLKACLQRNT